MKKDPPTKVVFRRWSNGTVIALFPQIPSDVHGRYCLSYEQVGQHGGADYNGVVMRTTPAKPDESADLQIELGRIGYDLKVAKRSTYKDRLIMIEELKKIKS